MALFQPELMPYLDSLVPPRRQEFKQMEAYAAEHDFPIIGPACGHFCYLIAKLIKAKRIFELGSGYGYSTAWFAQAIAENGGGEIFHVVWDEDLSRMAREHLGALGHGEVGGTHVEVNYVVSEAVEALTLSHGQFDLIFNDIDKPAYPASIPIIYERLRTGGMLIIDNMLWSGKIFDATDQSEATVAIRQTAQTIMHDPKWVATIVPIRDGMLLAEKR